MDASTVVNTTTAAKATMVAKAVTVRDLGLTVLADPAGATVDIMFIHGLQGHPRTTWLYSSPDGKSEKPKKSIFSRLSKSRKKPESQVTEETEETKPLEAFWPLDILPRDFPHARIMTYGYDSNITHWFKGPAMQLDIDQYGESLLNTMEAGRRGNPHRPLILIAHNLGGLILKDSLRRAKNTREERFKNVYKSIAALLFFRTPHRGGSYVELGLTVRKFAHLAGLNTNERILRSLSFNSTFARVLEEEFAHVLTDLKPRLFVFQEGLGLTGFRPLSGKVVEDVSSVLDVGEQKDTIVADHINMCRFSGADDDGYIKVKAALGLVMSEILPRPTSRQGMVPV
ncbi:putative alpha beta-hydrolase [Rosellinia necatrix]|uniref:Putative alpha beta-hydrolase n=1 Tax=Rosellinia necatrix TaxID=77044 RepID=A0A1W2TST0_ROSNE|nr:putative alpha beta-hydrolase [Rosellinia necatrix]